MCHTDESTVPVPPRSGAVGRAGDLRLTGADGAGFMAYRASPETAGGPGAVILPDLRGLHGFYRSFARRLAEAGMDAVAIDYYGRDLADGAREEPLETMFPLVTKLAPEQVAGDARAAADLLRGDGVSAVFSVGFCFGGSQAWNASAFDDGLAGCAGFYGRPDDCRPYLGRLTAPLLLLVAGADAMTPVGDFHAFDAELTSAGVRHEMTVYDGEPHGFFDAGAGAAASCDDAWRRLLDFVEQAS